MAARTRFRNIDNSEQFGLLSTGLSACGNEEYDVKSMGKGLRTHRLRDLRYDQRGITGFETAIVLIAFVVVASVFALC